MTRRLSFLVVLLAVSPATAAVLPAAAPLTALVLERMVEDELAADVGDGRLEIAIEQPALPLPGRAAQPTTLRLDSIDWDRRGGRFETRLIAELPSGERSTINVRGRALLRVEVPVPVRTLPRGAVIAAQDLERRWLPAARVPDDAVADAALLAGSETTRPLAAGRPIRDGDLAAARLVRRGELVAVVYRGHGIELTTVGEALDDAGHGEIVRVLNVDSKTMRRAVAEGPRRVAVLGQGELR